MNTPTDQSPTLARAQAIQNLLDLHPEYLHDIGPHLTCEETDAWAEFFRTHDRADLADTLLEGHAREDEEGDDEEHLKLQAELNDDESK